MITAFIFMISRRVKFRFCTKYDLATKAKQAEDGE
jgi:hypothetical protein